ncbi:MAG TPA: outer membrane beta-barrel protein [Chitinophagaceae bacterium]|nr:outer membrane beta-barrel protein [Chitinophagaceae bacterium]
MKQYLLPLLCISFVYATNAQTTVTGKITDEKKQPLPFAVMRLKKLPDTGFVKVTSADTAGNFLFGGVGPGSYLLETELVGYQPAESKLIVCPEDTLINAGIITLTISANMLGEVSVKARTPPIQKQIDRTVINVEQNIANAGTNALELLKKLPGVQVTPGGQVTLNGKPGVNIILDGKTTYLSAEDLANLLASMPSSDIAKIEIMTTPPAKYDAEGTGGIINIIRKKNSNSGLNGSAIASYGLGPHYDRYNSSLVLNYKTGKYNLYLNNSYGYSKGYNTSNSVSDILDGSALSSEQASTNTGITINKAFNSSAGLDLYLSKKTTLTLTGNISDRRYNNNLTSLMTFADSNLNKTGSENFSALNADKPFNFSTGAQLLYQLDTAGRAWSADIDYANYRYRPGQYNTGVNYSWAGSFLSREDVFVDEMRTLHIFGARADYVQPLPGNGKLEAGLKSSYVKTFNNGTYYNKLGGQNVVDSALSDYNINSENINAAYVNFSRQYGQLAVEAGLRLEQTVMKGQQLFTTATVNENYFGLYPTVFLLDKLNDRNTLNFQFGRRTDRPDYHEYVPFRRPLSATISFQGNPYLKPDVNWHTELTWACKNTFFITAAYDIDRNYMRTLYYLDTNKITITRMPTNVQGAHSWNVDISYNKQLAKWFTTNTTATIYQNSFSGTASDGFSLDDPGFATIDFVTNNSFRCSDKLSLEADFEYESKRQFVGSVFGAYSILSLALRQKILHGQGTITVNANNVLNTESFSSSDHYRNLYQYGYSYFYSRAVIVTFNYHFGRGKITKIQNKSGSQEEQQRAGN